MGLLAQARERKEQDQQPQTGGLLSRVRSREEKKQKATQSLTDPLGTRALIDGATAINRRKREEQRKAIADPLGTQELLKRPSVRSDAPLPSREELESRDEKLTQGGGLLSRVRRAVPEPIREAGQAISRGIFGAQDTDQPREDLPVRERGVFGILAPGLANTPEQTFTKYQNRAIEAGVDRETAGRIAAEKAQKSPLFSIEDIAPEEFSKLTQSQRDAIKSEEFWEKADIGFTGVDLATLGQARPITGLGRAAIRKLVRSTDEAENLTEIRKVIPDEETAQKVARLTVDAQNPEQVETAVRAGLEEAAQKARGVRPTSATDEAVRGEDVARGADETAQAGRAVDEVPEELRQEIQKFDTAEEFVENVQIKPTTQDTIRIGDDISLKLKTREDLTLGKTQNYAIEQNGKNIGRFELTDRGDFYQSGNVEILRPQQGIGIRVYEDLIRRLDKPLQSDPSRSEGAEALWRSLERKGLASKIDGVFRSTPEPKSQLTDIYNRVKGGDEVAGAPRAQQRAGQNASKRHEAIDQMESISRRQEQVSRDDISVRPRQRTRQEKKTQKLVSAKESPQLADQSSSAYAKSYDSTISKSQRENYVKELHPLEPKEPEKWTLWSKFRHNASNAWVTIREQIQDDFTRVRNLVQSDEVKITKELNPYQAEILFHGRVGSRLEDTRLEVIKIDQDIVSTARNKNIDPDELSSEVNAYLHARHAPERNKQLGDGAAGISTKEAENIVKEIESSEVGSEVKRIADRIQELNNRTLQILHEGEVISDELYKTLTERYKNHVPLQRIFEGEENIGDIISGRGFDVKSTGIKRARGSKREVSDIFTSVVTNYQQAVARAEKNRVDLATLHFARENKKQFGHLFEEIKPKAVGKTFDGKVIQERITDPQVLSMRENGKPVFLKIKDPNLAVTLKGVSRQKMDGIFRYVAAITRFYSGLQTRFNPEFAFPNKIRDIQEATIYAASRREVGFKGAVRIAGKEARLQNEGAVLDWLRGKDSDGAKLYQQMREDGGTTGGLGLSTKTEVELDLKKIRRINRSRPHEAAEMTIRYVDNWNRIFEDSTRLSVYRQAIEQGTSREKAAILAKTSSVNFNKTGRSGPIINGLYMFANASVQGSTKMLGVMKNPKVAATVISGVGVAVAAGNEWNDSIDPDWRDKVPEWDRLNSFVVVLPGFDEAEGIKYVAIPVSWGIKPIKVMMDKGYDLMEGKGDGLTDAADAIFVSIVEAYNPAGGTDAMSAITPTLLDLPVDVARNRAWHGGKIRPDWDNYAPDSIQYFESLEDTTTGRTFVGLSKGLSGIGIEVSPANMNYSYEQLVGGAGRTGSEFFNTIIGLGTGDIPPVRDIPVAGRFLRSRTGEEVGAGSTDYERIKEVLAEQSKERFLLKQQAEDAYQQLSNVPKEEAARRFEQIRQNDSDLADEIRKIKEQEDKNLTYTDRMLLQLGVSNGERARFLLKKFNSVEDQEQKAQLWNEYRQKGVISDNVADQLRFLISNPDEAR